MLQKSRRSVANVPGAPERTGAKTLCLSDITFKTLGRPWRSVVLFIVVLVVHSPVSVLGRQPSQGSPVWAWTAWFSFIVWGQRCHNSEIEPSKVFGLNCMLHMHEIWRRHAPEEVDRLISHLAWWGGRLHWYTHGENKGVEDNLFVGGMPFSVDVLRKPTHFGLHSALRNISQRTSRKGSPSEP